MTWNVEKKTEKDFENTILIEGLPGIGNVGKITADLLVQEFDTELVAQITSKSLPNAVFVKEDNTVKLPTIDIRHFEHDGKNFLFMVGDVQPKDSEKSYGFAEAVLEYAESQDCKEIITLGGIGLKNMPERPDLYATGNNKDLLEELGEQGANLETYGKVGPIMGISGLLLGLADEENIQAAALLGETMAHPMYVGLKGARQIINLLNERYNFGVETDDLDDQIEDMEDQLQQSLKNANQVQQGDGSPELGYIG